MYSPEQNIKLYTSVYSITKRFFRTPGLLTKDFLFIYKQQKLKLIFFFFNVASFDSYFNKLIIFYLR